MKLLYCKQCNEYQKKAYVGINVTVSTIMELTDDGWKISDFDFDFDRPGKLFTDVDLSYCRCEECNTKFEIIEVESCPHNWEEHWCSTKRVCHLCRTVQQGRVIYDETCYQDTVKSSEANDGSIKHDGIPRGKVITPLP
jgi:hypothetical protein